QQVLGPREALLVFHMPELRELDPRRRKSAWVLVITSQRAEAIELPTRAEILPRVTMLGPLVERRDQDIDAAAAKLGSLLLDDALAVLPETVDTLSMVLDGPLHQVPLASLRVGAEHRPLVERFAVGAVPSASLLVQWRDGRASPSLSTAEASPALLALADPPVPFITDGSDPALERAASLTEGLALLPLPLARREAELAARRPQDTLWVGAQASEAALDRLPLDGFGVLHFATHAVIDEQHPGRSAVVLAGENGDGLLQPRDIAGLDLAGKLVVLSACSTARGHVVAGEGVMGLAHAMFGAGAHTVIASLWPLRDDDGLALFQRFYPYLEAGDDVATALRRAQQDRAAEGAPPAAWAGVVVLGDPQLVPFPGGRVEVAARPGAAGDLGGIEALVMLLGVGLVAWGAWPRRGGVGAAAS
ncbi:MAG: CHAT domain-containing protein, partial [Nannocystaceae bacterium]